MKCSNLFKIVKGYWPSEIVVDMNLQDQINKLYWGVDSKIDHQKEHWLNLSAWSFHQALCKFKDVEVANGNLTIRISNIPIELFNDQMLFNLGGDDCWENEREEYQQP